MPCPENLIKKIATNRKATDDVLEKKKEEKDRSKITKIANLSTGQHWKLGTFKLDIQPDGRR